MNPPNSIRDWPAQEWETDAYSNIVWQTDSAGLVEMDKLALPPGDMEIRVWRMGSEGGDRCTVLRRTDGQWTRTRISQGEIDGAENVPIAIGSDLEQAEFLTMPEPAWEGTIDKDWTRWTYFAVQVYQGGRVRAFRYGLEGLEDTAAADIHRVLKKYTV